MSLTFYRLAAVLFLAANLTAAAAEAFPVRIQVDAAKTQGPLKPIWRFFGADEPNYAYMTHGKELLAELGELAPQQCYFRTHNLLNSGDGTAALKWGSTGVYRTDAQGRSSYDWTILDRIFDTYVERGVTAYAEIGFMPKELSSHPEPYQHHWTPQAPYEQIFTGWAYPPTDYAQWAELVFQWARHCLERYGRAEVERWFWEVWNEPNIGYWRGTPQEFLKLHDFAIDAVRRALPSAKVGGPDTAGSGGTFTRGFLEHCLHGTNFATGKPGTPLDFISFHAKGAPVYTNGHVRMGIAQHLRTVQAGFQIVASYPELKDKPIVIGESDPEGCAACQGPALAYRNGTMYSSYTAASFARIAELADQEHVNLEGVLTWAFEFEDQPYFAGFRSLASNGVDKPVLNVFRMFARMRGPRLAVSGEPALGLTQILAEGVRKDPDVSAVASLDQRTACILVWHYHDDDLPGPDADVRIVLQGLPLESGDLRVRHFRIDETHSNAYSVWRQMGSPQHPSPDQYARLKASGRLAQLSEPAAVQVERHAATLSLNLPRQAVSLLQVEW
jgi:xylan 1,4-beta-xylosidase